MNNNMKLAKELLVLAKSLVADEEGPNKKEWMKLTNEGYGDFSAEIKITSVEYQKIEDYLTDVYQISVLKSNLMKVKEQVDNTVINLDKAISLVNASQWIVFDENDIIWSFGSFDKLIVNLDGSDDLYKMACDEYKSLSDGGMEKEEALDKAYWKAQNFLTAKVKEIQKEIW